MIYDYELTYWTRLTQWGIDQHCLVKARTAEDALTQFTTRMIALLGVAEFRITKIEPIDYQDIVSIKEDPISGYQQLKR